MHKLIYCRLIFLLTTILFIPYNINAEPYSNSHVFLSKSLGSIRPPEDSAVTPIFDNIVREVNPTLNKKEIALLKNWIDTQTSNIKLIKKVIKSNHLRFPPIDVSTMEFPNFREYRSVLGLILIQAKIHLSQNDLNLAIVDILEALKFGRMVRYGERSTLLHYLIGISLEAQSLRWLQNILCTSKLSNKTLLQVLSVIEIEKVEDEAFIAALEGEVNNFTIPLIECHFKKIEPIFIQLEINQSNIYDKQDSINIVRKQFQKIRNNANAPWIERKEYFILDDFEDVYEIADQLEEFEYLMPDCDENEFDMNNAEHVAKWKELEKLAKGKSNLLGRFLISSSPSFEPYHERSVVLRTKLNITRTMIGLAIFSNKFGKYPKELNELVESKILTQIPLDLFSNRPLHYSSQSQKLWSTGSDGINDSGNKKTDIVLSCELIKKDQEPCQCN